IAGRGREGRELCYALCLRTSARFPGCRLDGARFETGIFFGEEKNNGGTAAGIFRNLFWRTWRFRTAIFVSSRSDEQEAKVAQASSLHFCWRASRRNAPLSAVLFVSTRWVG